MNFDEAKWKKIVDEWSADQPGVSDIETPPKSDTQGEMVLPTMDLSGPAAPGVDAPTRLRPPPPDLPATAGAGESGRPEPAPSPVSKPAAHPPPPESLDWKGLGDRLRAAELSKSSAQGYENMFANIGAQSGYRPNPHAGEVGVNMAHDELALAKAQQEHEKGALAMQGQKAAIGVKAAMDDPNSLQSQKAREAVQGMGLPLPKGFDNFSATDIHNFVKTGELVKLQGDQANERDRVAKANAVTAQKAGALADRKRTMLSLYPDHANEVNALSDLGDAQTLQTALEGRAGREATQAHSDTAAEVASRRALEREIALREWEAKHPKPQPMTAEQHTQLEALNKSEGVINEFEKALGKVDTPIKKAAASFPKPAGAMGAEGSEFPSARTMAATQLARGLEGGTAKPGNVEMIDQILPTHLDDKPVRAHKLEQLRAQMKANREGFMRAMEQSGQKPPAASGAKVKVSNGKETLLIDPGDAEAAASDGYKRVQ